MAVGRMKHIWFKWNKKERCIWETWIFQIQRVFISHRGYREISWLTTTRNEVICMQSISRVEPTLSTNPTLQLTCRIKRLLVWMKEKPTWRTCCIYLL
jgi:hypothetical protein